MIRSSGPEEIKVSSRVGGALFPQGPLFSPGEVFQVANTLKMGTVKKLRNDNWEQVNNWPQNIYYYHVNFNDGSFETYLSEDMMVKISSPYNPLNILQSNMLNPGGCRFHVGEKVNVSDKSLHFRDPHREEYVANKNGVITTIYPKSPYTIPPNSCLYEIRFDDATIAIEVIETNIKKTTSIENDLRNLALISNMNQMISNNRNQTLFNTRNELDDLSINDDDLQKDVTKYFYKKTLKWLGENHEFSKLKKQINFIKSDKGLKYIKSLLKLFMKKTKAKWYELREENYDDVKEFIRTHLKSI